jgi:hypothetical protein
MRTFVVDVLLRFGCVGRVRDANYALGIERLQAKAWERGRRK